MNKEILKLAIPNILSNITVPLLSSFDTGMMGHLSTAHIGAVGLSSMIFNFIYWNFGFLRMGTTGMTAQAYGQKDDQKMGLVFGRAILVSTIIALLLILLKTPLLEASYYLMNIEAVQQPLVKAYFDIRIWAAPATLASYAFMGWFFGMQNAYIPLLLSIIVNLANIGLSYYMVFHQNAGIEGVAYGTLWAQYLGLVVAIVIIGIKYRYLIADLKLKLLLKKKAFLQFLNINRDIFIRTLFLTFAFAFFHSQSSGLGEQILAINIILLNFLNWMSFGVDGFAFATESLVGKYKGAKDEKRLGLAIRLSFRWGMFVALCFSLCYAIFGAQILGLFTTDTAVIAAAKNYLFWIILLPIIATPSYIWDGIFIGLTASKAMRNTMVAACLFYMGLHFSLIGVLGNHGMWLAFCIFMGARGVLQHILFLRRQTDLN